MRFAALLVLVVVMALAGCGGSAATTGAPFLTTTTTAAAATTTTAAATTTTSATARTTGSAAWQKVFELSDNGNEETETFTLSGAPCRLTYKVTAEKDVPMLAFAAYLLPEGYDLDKKGGFPDVFITEEGADSIELTKDAGSYFLHVKAANCDYTITIEEEK